MQLAHNRFYWGSSPHSLIFIFNSFYYKNYFIILMFYKNSGENNNPIFETNILSINIYLYL
jgi:hypothetical protein